MPGTPRHGPSSEGAGGAGHIQVIGREGSSSQGTGEPGPARGWPQNQSWHRPRSWSPHEAPG